MNVAPGAPCESKNQRAREFNKGRREYGPESRREEASKTNLRMMMMTFIIQRGESQGKTNKERKATKSRGRGLEEGARRALMRQDGEEGCGERG